MSATSQAPQAIYRQDYQSPRFEITRLRLNFDLHEAYTEVTSTLCLKMHDGVNEITLDGVELELLSLKVNAQAVAEEDLVLGEESLKIKNLPQQCDVEIVTRIYPHNNTALEGLYRSSGNYCTQCEAEGFRKITYFPDRPDVLTSYTTRIEADKASYPVLLSNGNLIEEEALPGGRHAVTWHDPYNKPCYLFALVAGKLEYIEETLTTMNGREVSLRIYVQAHNLNKTEHAMRSLIKAMQWDEQVYGREYDLDIYMIVAVDDFNMGAMENKGLNIFNSKYVLARPDTATDSDYEHIESVIAHEYFHNWSGNRVTCRDWFQLSLKEGFTVFRDQCFSADMTSHGVKRIDDVNVLRNHQFVEDAGPLAHPVRPESYIEINNFYTVTIYNKGAEVVRMQHTLLGAELFRRGTDLYFERFDGQAVTIEEFVACMEEVSGRDLTQFRRWYSQAGTPQLSVSERYDEAQSQLTLKLKQHTRATPGQDEKQPFHIPVRVGLIFANGEQQDHLLELTEYEADFVFRNLPGKPIVSMLRDFSAPVNVHFEQSLEDKLELAKHDADAFNRWNTVQQIYLQDLLNFIKRQSEAPDQDRDQADFDNSHQVFAAQLEADQGDLRLYAALLQLPSYNIIAAELEEVDPVAVQSARKQLTSALALRFEEQLKAQYTALHAAKDNDVFSQQAIGQRAVKNVLLRYLMSLGDRYLNDAQAQFEQAEVMTESLGALSQLAESMNEPAREGALQAFYQRWQEDNLVLDKWFAVQAMADLPDQVERMDALMEHEAFTYTNPNRLRSVVGSFSAGNPAHFHREDGAGYDLLARVLYRLDDLNPQVAARMAQPFSRWRQLDQGRQARMQKCIRDLMAKPKISRDLFEILEKSLAG